MSFDVLALSILVLLWAILGAIPWLGVALWRRGSAVLSLLPLAAVGGIGGGLVVPALGGKDGLGLILSLLAALVGGLALTLAGVYLQRRLSGAVPPRHQ